MEKKVIDKLYEYASIEGSEIGELCHDLLGILQYKDYFMTKKIAKALEDEIKAQLANFEEHSTIEEREKTNVSKYKYLNWIVTK